MIIIALGVVRCWGALPKGAETNGADFHPVYSNPTPGEIPITGWYAFTEDDIEREWFEKIRGSGVNIALAYLTDTASISKALGVADRTGLKIMLRSPLLDNPKSAYPLIERIRGYKSLAGYLICDEPNANLFGTLRIRRNMVYTMDTTRTVMMNLFPVAPLATLHAASYTDYVLGSIRTVDLPLISYDNYPIYMSDGERTVKNNFYENLQIVSDAARDTGRIFWAFGMVLEHMRYPEATEEDLRFEIFNALAYGAQGIEYYRFMYSPNPRLQAKSAPIMTDGTLTTLWDRMKVVNAEIQGLTDVFLGCRVRKLGHLRSIPEGCGPLIGNAGPFSLIRPGREGVLVSEIENGGRHYVVIVNHDPVYSQRIRLKWKGSLRRVYSNSDIRDFNATTINLPGGGYAIFTY